MNVEDVPIWQNDSFDASNDTPTLHSEFHEVDGQFSATKPDGIALLGHVPKSRPTPIYRERLTAGDWTLILEDDRHLQRHSQPPSRCPSLMSNGTLSSRNSSTRSTRSSAWGSIGHRDSNAISTFSIPEDANLSTRTPHFTGQLAEICPVKTCDRHRRGFTKAGDRARHVLTHCTRILNCGFCERKDSKFIPDHFTQFGWQAEAFTPGSNRVNLFLDHLVTYHGVREGRGLERPPKHPLYGVPIDVKQWRSEGRIATCAMCREPFAAQTMYEHLPGCILRDITRKADTTARRQCETSVDGAIDPDDDSKTVSHPLVSVPRDEDDDDRVLAIPEDDKSNCASRPAMSPGYNDLAELTASSRCLSLTSSKGLESSEEDTDWSEEVTSRDSSPGVSQLPRQLSPAKRRVVDTIMTEFQRLFSQNLRTHTTGESSSNSSSGGTGGWSSNTSTYSNASFVSRKRSLSGGGSTPPNDDDDTNKRRRPGPKSVGKQPMSELRFACPYYKRNPGRHQTFTSCRDPGFITVARLKEHLYRRHLLPPQCHRCCTSFTDDIALREHQRDLRGCEVRQQIPLEGFDKDQERRLKSKKRSQVYQSEEDKWKGVYRILFPDDAEESMPAPCIEYQPCTGDAELSNTIRFQVFSRLELPRLVRRTLETVVEQETQPLEEKLKERLVDIVKQCQTQLETMFQVTSSSTTLPAAFGNFDSLPERTAPTSVLSNEQTFSIPSLEDGTLATTAITDISDPSYDSIWPPATRTSDLSISGGEAPVVQADSVNDPLMWSSIEPFLDNMVWDNSADGLQWKFT